MLLGDLPALVNLMLLAVGGAVALGTGAALIRYRRTGAFPSQPLDRPPERSAVRGAVAKLVVGVVLALWGLAGLTLPD
jgi:hypothetical protein